MIKQFNNGLSSTQKVVINLLSASASIAVQIN